jgi:hypothetical protein
MSDPYKKLEEQLTDVVRARRPTRAWWSRGVVPIVAVVGVLGSGAATAAVVLRPDDRAESQVRQALTAGERAAAVAPACDHVRTSAPRMVDDPVPPWLSARLGVLRRPATAADRVPRKQLGFGGTEVLTRSVRVARATDGWNYRFFLSRGVMHIGAAEADPLACAKVRQRASVEAARGFDASVRREVAVQVGRTVRAVADQVAGRTLTLSQIEVRPDGRTAGGGAAFLRAGRLPATGSVGTFRRGNRRSVSLSGLVPDGVAEVRILDRDGTPKQRPRVVRVNDNVYHALLPHRFGPRMTVEWRDASGRVLRRTHPRY